MISKIIESTNVDNNLNVVVKTPGNLDKHYSPRAKIFINNEPKKGEGLIALSNIKTPDGVKRLLAPINDEEFAEGLYEALRQGDKLNLAVINVYTPENTGLGVAINDRINKAKGALI
jgi:L-threonylcarbamoyladenylate synthase